MKKYIIISKNYLLLLVSLVIIIISCTDGFDKINTDPGSVSPDELNPYYVWAGYLKTMQRTVIAEGTTNYQVTEDLHGNVYAGYTAPCNNWNNGYNSTTYDFPLTLNWQDYAFRIAYTEFLPAWHKLRSFADSTSIPFAVGEVIKVLYMNKITDMYGPLPYLKNGIISNNVPYDSQKAIYESFFNEIEHALSILQLNYDADPTQKPIEDFDLIYGSDLLKWIKFANSLKLRLAMRISYVDPVNAKKYAEEAVNNSYGIISDNIDNAVLKSNTTLNYAFSNPYFRVWQGYNDSRMSADMQSFLEGYSDPRLALWYDKSAYSGNTTYNGIRRGIADGNVYGDYSLPKIQEDSPLYWITAAEIFFLRAEGAYRKWEMNGITSELYNSGITAALSLHGISSTNIETYKNSQTLPASYTNLRNTRYSNTRATTITVKWSDTDSDARKLERIITQKWLAMYPNGQEAWSEYRRTGYPALFPVVENYSGGKVNSTTQIRRLPFPYAESTAGNEQTVGEAVTNYLGGKDEAGVKLWWDAK